MQQLVFFTHTVDSHCYDVGYISIYCPLQSFVNIPDTICKVLNICHIDGLDISMLSLYPNSIVITGVCYKYLVLKEFRNIVLSVSP